MDQDSIHPGYHWLIPSETARALAAYRQRLIDQGLALAGEALRAALHQQPPSTLSAGQFLERLVNTKRPQYFAESAVYGDGRDWNATELSLLGDLGLAAPVQVFDDGRHHSPDIHATPFAATLLFIPGALLRNGRGRTPADWNAVTHAGRIDPVAYGALYQRRLQPLFEYANADAAARKQEAVITLPGLGCGQFAGPFAGTLGPQLQAALMRLLERQAKRWAHIRLVYFDPYIECHNLRVDYGALSFRVRPFLQGHADTPQLCAPSRYAEPGDDIRHGRLYSLVAWDPVSWPGNDYWAGARITDDGVKAAATDLMRVITGVQGHYDPERFGYHPPAPYSTWEAVAQDRGTRLRVATN